jgi:hypothetical protein
MYAPLYHVTAVVVVVIVGCVIGVIIVVIWPEAAEAADEELPVVESVTEAAVTKTAIEPACGKAAALNSRYSCRTDGR